MNIISLYIFRKTERLQNEIDSLRQEIKKKNTEKELQEKKEIEDIEREIEKNEKLLQGNFSRQTISFFHYHTLYNGYEWVDPTRKT